MIKHSLLLYVCLGIATHMQAEQFVYPVADFAHGNQLALIYQKSLQDIELWFLNTTKNLISAHQKHCKFMSQLVYFRT
jgi:hypothetical protein